MLFFILNENRGSTMNENTNIKNAFTNIQTAINAKIEIIDILPEEILFLADSILEQIEIIKSNAEKLKG